MDFDLINSVFRILFAFFFSFKLFYTLKAIELNFLNRDLAIAKINLIILFILNIFIFFGFYASLSAFLMFFIQRYIYYRILMYTLEDVYFHTATVFLILANTSNFYALNNHQLFNFDNFLPYYALVIGVGATFFSASIAKFKDKIWHNGKAIFFFFTLPYRRRIDFRKISFFSNLHFTKFLGKFQIALQLILLPACLLMPKEIALLIALINLIFCFVLVVFFHFLWLAELCFVMMLTICFGIYLNENGSIFFQLIQNIELNLDSNNIAKIILLILTFTLITQPIINFFDPKNKYICKLNLFLFKLNRITFGLVPIKVFTALHIENPLIFKMRYKFSKYKSKSIEVFKLYKDDGTINYKWIGVKPTLFSALTYKINDFLLEVDKNNISEGRKSLIKGIFKYIEKYEIRKPDKNGKLEIFISQIDTSDFNKIKKFKKLKFHKAVEINMKNSYMKIKRMKKIFKIKTFRDINRENLIPSFKV